MKTKRTDMTWQISILIICISYTLGIIFGFLFTDNFNLNSLLKLNEISDIKLINNLFFYMKFSFPIWLAGFFTMGVFFTLPWCAVCGCFYGASAFMLMALDNSLGFFINALEFVLFTGTIFIFSMSSLNLSLNKYRKYKNPKSRLPREQTRKVKEHIVFLLIGLLLTLIASLLKTCSL